MNADTHFNNYFRAVVSMEPDDPHLVVNCARSLITLPYLSQDDIHLFKEIISIAINMALNDSTVIEAIKRAINIYRAIVRINEKLYVPNKNIYIFLNILKVFVRIRIYQLYF